MENKNTTLCQGCSYLQVVMLSLLLSLEIEPSQPPQILLAHSFVDGGAAADTLAVVVGGVGPPVGLHLHVAEDHVLDRSWKTWDLIIK